MSLFARNSFYHNRLGRRGGMWHNLSRVFQMEWSAGTICKWDEEVKKLDVIHGRMNTTQK